MLKITICPTCGSDQINKVKRNWTSKLKSKNYIVPNLEFYECSFCEEKVFDREAMQKIEIYSPNFAKKQAKKMA
jgi:YgiT-type zinc finger domain-containing protein